jgi:sortase A
MPFDPADHDAAEPGGSGVASTDHPGGEPAAGYRHPMRGDTDTAAGDPASGRDAAGRRPEAAPAPAAAALGPAAAALAAAAAALEAGGVVDPSILRTLSPADVTTSRAASAPPRPPASAPPASAPPAAAPAPPDPAPPAAPAPPRTEAAAQPGLDAGNGRTRTRPGTRPTPAGPPGAPRAAKPKQRHRKLVAGLLIGVSALLVLGAIGVGGYPFYTDIRASRNQKVLAAQLAREKQATGDARLKLIQEYESRNFAIGSAITKILIPALNVDDIVVQGTSDQALNVGAGHYPQTPLPGDVGNVAIAGHRTMNGHPFGDLNKLVPGDQVILETPFATYTYRVIPPFDGHANPWVVAPTDWSVIEFPTQDHLLTLTTCNPPGQATTRLVARATLIKTQPA